MEVKEINPKSSNRLPHTYKDNDQEEFDQTPIGYRTIQNTINSYNGHINPRELEKHLDKLVVDGWKELDKKYIVEYVEAGMRIRYITKENKFRTGGWVIRTKPPEEDDDEMDGYVLYKAHNGTIWSLQISDIDRFFFITKDQDLYNQRLNKRMGIVKPKRARPSKYKNPENPTNYPVFLHDRNGTRQIVYFAKDNSSRDRFMETEKYQNALINGWSFT